MGPGPFGPRRGHGRGVLRRDAIRTAESAPPARRPATCHACPVIPPPPDVAPDGEGRSPVVMRYEDVAQNGRVLVESLATSVNETLWNAALRGHPLDDHTFAKGTLAILSRFLVETGDGPFSVSGPFEAVARVHLAHRTNEAGAVERIYLNGWVDTYAPVGRTNFAPPPEAGTRALVGRAFAEHVFTRPFAPPGDRKVLALALPGAPAVPPLRYVAPDLVVPGRFADGAVRLDAGLALEETPVAFGLRHTDSNQHVNSLVYPQHFEEAVLRRLARLGRDTAVIARALDITYRKPFFAGQAARIALALAREDDALVANGAFFDHTLVEHAGGIAGVAPHAVVRMAFDLPHDT